MHSKQTGQLLPSVRQTSKMSEDRMLQLLQCAIANIALFTTGRDHDFSPDDNFLTTIKTFLLDPGHFVAGNIRHHLPAWKALFDSIGVSSKAAAVLQWVEHGVSFDFVHPLAEVQQAIPRYKERLQLVHDLLSKTVSAGSIDELLDCDTPGQVHFANRVSCTYYSEFVRQQRDELLASGALVQWDAVSAEKPQVVSGLGVVKNHKGKLRLMLDCRYLNLFLPYEHFKYEQLSDAVEYLQPDDWFMLTDAKSGYHHIPMHEATWTYLAVEIDGMLYAHTHMPFGLAIACRTYSTVMGEVYRTLRLNRQNMTFLIDDALFAFSSKQQGLFRTMTLLLLLTALGFHLSWEKCELLPVQQGKFLGLVVDTAACQLRVPADKVQRIKDSIQAILQQQAASSRQLAGIDGMLMAAAPALYMAPLYPRGLYQAMHPEAGWDSSVPQFGLTEEDLQYWLQHIDTCNGKCWLRRHNVVNVCGDASSIGYAAYTPHGEVGYDMIMSFEQSEIESMHEGTLSSVYREIKNARLALQYVV